MSVARARLVALVLCASSALAVHAAGQKAPAKALLECNPGEERATDVEQLGEEPKIRVFRTDYCKPTQGTCGKGRHPVETPVRVGSRRAVVHCEDGKPLGP